MDSWNTPDDRPKPKQIWIRDVRVGPGSRVRLWPRGRADIFDMALEGKTATVEAVEQDYDNRVFLAVTVEDDPGKDFGEQRKPAHRFFFRPDEIEPLHDKEVESE
jgi:hypothetical protein